MKFIQRKDGNVTVYYYCKVAGCDDWEKYTRDEILQMMKDGIKLEVNGLEDTIRKSETKLHGHRKRDTFQPGYNNALGMHIKSKAQMREEYKKRGLVEIGNETYTPHKETLPAGYITEESIKDFNQMGLTMDDNQANHLIDLDKADKLHEGVKTEDGETYDPKSLE